MVEKSSEPIPIVGAAPPSDPTLPFTCETRPIGVPVKITKQRQEILIRIHAMIEESLLPRRPR